MKVEPRGEEEVCGRHRKYRGKRVPAGMCYLCWRAFIERNPTRSLTAAQVKRFVWALVLFRE